MAEHPRPRRSRPGRPVDGFTLIELMLVTALVAASVGIALPLMAESIDELRTASAARYLAARIMSARVEALKRSTPMGLRFQPMSGDYGFRVHLDGNGNGLRTADIQQGLDPPMTNLERLGDNFPGVRFELMADVPDVDGGRDDRTDGVRIGTSRILTLGPDGTATSGTLYVRGRRSQYAVRVLGATARTRVLQFHTGEQTWISR